MKILRLALDGTFLDVRVVKFHEPVFVDGLEPEPLFDFVKQYAGKSLKQAIKVGPPGGGGVSEGAVAIVAGVAKATASVRILNEIRLDGAEAAPALLARFGAEGLFVGKEGKLWRTSGFAIAEG